MQITFLSASDGTPLTKRFKLKNNQITKHSYPNVLNFSSTSHNIQNLEEFYNLTILHADKGDCLLKGIISHTLNNTSRANSTNATDNTQWVLFDLDNVLSFESIEDFIQNALPPEFHKTSYIIHRSSSEGIISNSGLNCHLAFFLHEVIPSPTLKILIETINYSNPTLRKQLSLTASGATLRYTLDITTCQNDKLIFIAPPILEEGVVCSLAKPRIEYINKNNDFVHLTTSSLSPEQLRQIKDKIVASLRKDAGLAPKKFTYKMEGTTHYIANPDQASITGIRRAREFTYLNLNGGDSWAYYFPDDNPEFLYSFKEPGIAYKLKDINPEFAAQHTPKAIKLQPNKTGATPIVFRDILTDTYWNGYYYIEQNIHRIHKASSKDRLKDFMIDKGCRPPKIIPDWEISFDPTTSQVIDFEDKKLNLFVPTPYMMEQKDTTIDIPPITKKVIYHVVGNDDEAFHRLLNWIACKFQTRQKLMTAWILTGIEGTGKGLLFHNILVPLFGQSYCQQRSLDNLEDSFNAWEEQTIIMNFNEARISDSPKVSKIMNKLKNMITEPVTSVRGMRANLREVISYLDVIITSNNNDAIIITDNDRRFNICPRQDTAISISTRDIDILNTETTNFAKYLLAYEINIDLAHTVMANEAKETMHLATRNSVEQILEAIKSGNLEHFTQFLTSEPSTIVDHNYSAFSTIILRWIDSVGTVCKIPRGELITVYSYLQASNFIGPNKFSRLLSLHDIHLKNFRNGGQIERGVEINWDCNEDIIRLWKERPYVQAVT